MTAADDAALHDAGFNLRGALPARRYDTLVPPAWRTARLLPGTRTALVLGCGGHSFGEAFLRSPEAGLEEDPIDRFTARVVRSAASEDACALFYWERRGGVFADFVALGRACGLGVPSRLGLLIHPVYGPWLSLRALLLTRQELSATPELRGFDPCGGCPAPCASACPGRAVALESFDVAACVASARRTPACRIRCDARRACVVGGEHAYPPALEERHRRAVLATLCGAG